MSDKPEKIKCEICGLECKPLGMGSHLNRTHNIKPKDYFDKYYKKEEDGFCKTCGKPTRFINIYYGYNRYCNSKCANLSSEVRDRIKQSNLEKYGTEHANKSDVVKNKIKQTNLERYGVESALKLDRVRDASRKAVQSETAKAKRKATNLKKYGTEQVWSSKEVRSKVAKTNLEKYGSENVFGSKQIQEKIKQTNLERYGAENVYQSDVIKNKIKNKVEDKYGGMGFSSEVLLEKSLNTKQRNIEKYCLENNLVRLSDIAPCIPLSILDKEGIKVYRYMTNTKFVSRCDEDAVKKLFTKYETYKLDNENRKENYLASFIKSIYNGEVIQRNRSIISPFELDIYIPDKKLAIEFNGNYWHSENAGVDKEYHLNKTNLCNGLGIRLIHVYEWEWDNKQEIVKSIISSALGVFDRVIYAKNCEVKSISLKQSEKFFEENHIQGSIKGSMSLGLFYKDELVQAVCVGKSRFTKNEFELYRSCSKLNTKIIGGFDKLIKSLDIDGLISFVDKSKFNGRSYFNWKRLSDSKPSYVYYKGNIRLSRFSTKKHLLPNLLGDLFDPNKTEEQNMLDAGWLKVYDCGNMKFQYFKS